MFYTKTKLLKQCSTAVDFPFDMHNHHCYPNVCCSVDWACPVIQLKDEDKVAIQLRPIWSVRHVLNPLDKGGKPVKR
jgi:hypothetical protein